MRPLNFTN